MSRTTRLNLSLEPEDTAQAFIIFNEFINWLEDGLLTEVYRAITGTGTVLAGDYTVNATSGTFTLTLLTAVGRQGKIYNLKNSGTGVITLATTSGQTIDGQASGDLTLNQYDNLQVQSDGANWNIL